MSWNYDPELEKRASDQNPDLFDRSAAQHELYRRESDAEMRLNNARQQTGQTYPTQKSFFDKRAGYVGFVLIVGIIVSVLANPEALTVNFAEESMITIWFTLSFGLWLILFISLSMLNRGKERFINRLIKRFVFSVFFAGFFGLVLAIRIAML